MNTHRAKSVAALSLALWSLASACVHPEVPRAPSALFSCGNDPAFAFVPAGSFVFGSDADERALAYRLSAQSSASNPQAQSELEASLRARHFFDAEPARSVRNLPSFCLQRQPVTQSDYATFVRATGHPAPGIDEASWRAQGFLVHDYPEVQHFVWQSTHPPEGTERQPVVLVSVEDALAYARWRSERDHRTYELPSREAWEKAARGTDGRIFPWGNSWRSNAVHWQGTGPRHPSNVGAFPDGVSPFGHELLGNVFEWTSTREGLFSVLKGCAWDDLAGFCRPAYEHRRRSSSRHLLVSFRLLWR